MKKALKNALIPHKGNDYRPRALCPKAIAGVIVALIVFQFAFFFVTSYVVPRSSLFGIIEVGALTDGTNQARINEQLPPLTINPLLQAAAQQKADDMVKNSYFAHTSPAGVTPWYWFINVGYNFSYAGENLAVNFSDSKDVTGAWLNSPDHRANILDPHFTQIGMAVARGTYNGQTATYIVELFGAPSTGSLNLAKSGAPKIVTRAVSLPPVVTVARSTSTNTEPISVAVKGVEAQTVPEEVAVTPTIPVSALSHETNVIERVFANPVSSVNYLYYLILAFFLAALSLNVFIKIRTQHPDLILGGLVAVSILAIFIVTNQQMLLGVVIK